MSNPKVNEHLVQIMGGIKNVIHIEHELEVDQDYSLLINGSVEEVNDKTNHDGTVNRIYKIKGIFAEEI